MPSPHSLVMLVGDPENYRPVRPVDSIESARKQGFTDFTFHPTARRAAEAARSVEGYTERKAISFTEVMVIEGTNVVLHIVGQTPRPKPIVKTIFEQAREWANRPTCPPRVKYVNPVSLLEGETSFLKHADVPLEGQRILMHAAWHLENPPIGQDLNLVRKWRHEQEPAHNAKLDAFAVFIAEWAAKIKNAARSR